MVIDGSGTSVEVAVGEIGVVDIAGGRMVSIAKTGAEGALSAWRQATSVATIVVNSTNRAKLTDILFK